jgi:hypothetical protein
MVPFCPKVAWLTERPIARMLMYLKKELKDIIVLNLPTKVMKISELSC